MPQDDLVCGSDGTCKKPSAPDEGGGGDDDKKPDTKPDKPDKPDTPKIPDAGKDNNPENCPTYAHLPPRLQPLQRALTLGPISDARGCGRGGGGGATTCLLP